VESGRRVASTRWTPLYEEPLVVIAPAKATGDTLHELLEGNPFLRFDRTQRTGLQIDRVLRRLNVHVHEFLELNAIETVVELVRQEVGVSLLPLLKAAQWGTAPDLRLLPLPEDIGPVVRSIGLIDRREHSRQAITDSIFQRCAQLQDDR